MKKLVIAVLCAVVAAVCLHGRNAADAAEKRILLIPAGSVDRGILQDMKQTVSHVFGRDTDIGEEIRLPSDGYDNYRLQYSSTMIMNALEGYNLFREIGQSNRYERTLVVLDADIFAPGTPFVYYDANLGTGRAVVSMTRLREDFYKRVPDRYKFADRVQKMAVRAIAQTYGLGSCNKPRCVMGIVKEVSDVDFLDFDFCTDCHRKYRALTKGTY
ncbi:MAG TPA: hypothetical protein P5287_07590 [bacterium]|nr:hypothetical protein [bacterium]